MTRTTTLLLATLALAGAACSQRLQPMMNASTGGTTGFGTGGRGTGGETTEEETIPLPSTSTGFVEDAVSGVIGPWYAYGDGVGPNPSPTNGGDGVDSDCQSKGGFPPADCSQILTPTPGQPFPPTDAATSKMCTSGTAAFVMAKNGNADYSDLWGAGIGLNFNDPGPDAGAAGSLNLSGFKGIAFDFSADVLPNQSMRVTFAFQGMHGGDEPYWMGATLLASPLTGTTASPQHVEIDWTDVGGPFYLAQETPPVTPPVFDPTKVQSIQFQVFTNTSSTTPYSFCVANLALVEGVYSP